MKKFVNIIRNKLHTTISQQKFICKIVEYQHTCLKVSNTNQFKKRIKIYISLFLSLSQQKKTKISTFVLVFPSTQNFSKQTLPITRPHIRFKRPKRSLQIPITLSTKSLSLLRSPEEQLRRLRVLSESATFRIETTAFHR